MIQCIHQRIVSAEVSNVSLINKYINNTRKIISHGYVTGTLDLISDKVKHKNKPTIISRERYILL